MELAEILKFAALAYLLLVGLWFSTAQAKFSRASKARPMLFIMVGLSIVTTILTLVFSLSQTIPYERIFLSLGMTTASVALIKWAFRSIRKRNLGLAFSGIVPDEVVQHGPYRHVRHPLYLAYSIFWASCAVLSGSIAVAIAAFLVILTYVSAARSEERDLINSGLGETYSAYQRRTGLLLPRLF